MKKKYILTILLLTTFLLSCGGSSGSGSDLSGIYSVDDVNILADDVQRGEVVRTEVFFQTKIESDGTPDGLQLVVRIPKELSYIPSSSELYDGSTDDADFYSPSNIIDCNGNEMFLVYNFNDFDLFEHELGNFGQFGIKILVQGRTSTPQAIVSASAGQNESFSCDQDFDSEQDEAVEVL